jgi:4-amino-4-deoxy-L-arabinose transferase-like glycosyltransferase
VVKDGIREAISRSWEVQGQSPLYYLIAWVTRQGVGSSELGMRLPSVLFAALTALLLYRLGRRFVDAEVGRIAVVGFVVWPAVAFSASDARPYALATLAVVASTAALVRWLDTGDPKTGVAYVFIAASVVYVHYLFGLALIPHLVYARSRTREGSTVLALRAFVAAGSGIALLVAPLTYEVLILWHRRQEWSIHTAPTVEWVASVVVPAAFVVAALFGGIAAVAQGEVSIDPPKLRRSDLVFLVSWLLFPITILLGVSIFTSASLVQTRYTLAAAPAAVLLLAIALRSVEPASARRIIVLVVATISVLDLAKAHHESDWRGAAALAGSIADTRTLVLVQPGFTESDQLSWYADPERRSFLLAPVSFYPIPGHIVPLPANIDSSTQDFVRQEVAAALLGVDRVVLVDPGSPVARPWLREFLGPQWVERDFSSQDFPFVTEFSRAS